jgi:beta-1,4-mannosyl-glycoprotein beta-1,4-N-acetylglucosaminyltransferase
MFGDETDMLQCRLEEAEPYDVRHILIEAPFDHQGHPKPLYYGDNKSRYAAWNDRITHIVARIPGAAESAGINPWVREHAQREHMWGGLAALNPDPDDILLACDVDEIPSPPAYRLRGAVSGLHAASMRLAMFAVDWVYPVETRIAIFGRVRDFAPPVWRVRDNGMRAVLPEVTGMGWHFTWLGGPDAIRRKATQFCHLELRDMILKANDEGMLYGQGRTWHGMLDYPPRSPDNYMVPVTVDESWPKYIREGRCPRNWYRPQLTEVSVHEPHGTGGAVPRD